MPKAAKSVQKAKTDRPDTQEDTALDTSTDVEFGDVEMIDEVAGTILDEMDDDSYLLVHRTHPITKKMEYLGRLNPREATVEIIQERCGGGMFVCREKVRNKDGQMVYKRQRSFEVAGAGLPSEKINLAGGMVGTDSKKKEDEPVETGSRKSVDEELTAIIKGGVINMMQSQQEMTSTQISALKGLIEASRDNKSDSGNDKMFEMMMAQQASTTAILTALLQNRPEQPDITDQLAKLAEIMKTNTSPQSSAKDTLEMIQSFIGVRQDIDDYHRGPPEDPEDFATFAMKRMDKIIDMISSAKDIESLKREVAQLPPGAPTTPPGAPAQPQPQPGAQPVDKWAHMLKGQIPRYVSLASRQKNPVLAADADFDAMTENAMLVVKQLLSGENPLNTVIVTYPELAPHVNWVNEYLGRMHQHLFPEAYQEQEQPTASISQDDQENGFGPPAESGAMVMEPMEEVDNPGG